MARRARSCSPQPCLSHVYEPRKRRFSEDAQSLSHIKSIESLRHTVSKEITNRLARGGVDLEGVAPQLLDHCLPSNADSKFWETLLHAPTRAPDHMLMQALRLRVASKEKQSEKRVRQTVFYMRSFALTARQLRDVIFQFHDSGLEYTKTRAWLNFMDTMQPEDVAYIRYVGRTNRGVLRRHREDLLTRKSGFLAKFLVCLERLCPTIIDSAAIYVFPTQQFPDFKKNHRFDEIREQAIIALLGLPSLLNQALTGAAKWHFTPSKLHYKNFQDLETNTISRLDPALFTRIHEPKTITAWANDIQRYAREHRLSVSTYRNKYHDFPDSLRDMILEQAIPSAFRGNFVFLLTVGAGISQKAYHEKQAFYTGSSDSARLIKSCFNRLWDWEQPHYLTSHGVDDLISAGAFPFVDLCPWYRAEGEDLIAAAGFLKQYTMAIRPLIILTLAAKPSSTVASGFRHPFGYPSSCRFWSKVGQLDLVYCNGLCCIQIPCFHPGQGRFSIDPNTFLVVLDMTLWVVVLTISVSLDSAEEFETKSREDWCQHIKSKVDEILHSRGFYRKFDFLKEKLQSERPSPTSTTLTLKARSKVAIATRTDVDRCIISGFAVDRPFSDRRRQQVYRLWDLGIPELHIHIRRENPQDWFMWANNLEEGTSFFVDAILKTIWSPSDETESEPCLAAARQRIKAHSSEFHEFLMKMLLIVHDKRLYMDAMEAIATEISNNLNMWQWAYGNRISDGLLQAGISRFTPVYQVHLNATEVFVWKNCSFAIYWVTPGGHKYKFVMRAPGSSRDTAHAPRKYIFFTKEGIDLRDDTGTSCLVHKGALGSKTPVTFPIQRLCSCQDTTELGQRLVELWELETGLDWKSSIALSLSGYDDITGMEEYPPNFFQGKGLDLIKLNWKNEKLWHYKRKPQPADETWLLWMCLQENWPTGGTLFIGIPAQWPSRADNFWVYFQNFLVQGKYRNHPRITQMQAWAQDLLNTRKTSQLIRNLEHLCRVEGKTKIQARDYKRIKIEGKDVRIAGTELRILPLWSNAEAGSNNTF